MPSAAALRLQIETALARRIPSALTPAPKLLRPVAPTGVPSVDALLDGGLPIGAITEMVGPESSGRTSLALSFVAGLTRQGHVGAWIDVSNMLDPESAASAGVDLSRLLWVRCGAAAAQASPSGAYRFALPEKYFVPPQAKQGLHGGGCGGHPRNETKGLAEAVTGLLRPASPAPAPVSALAPRCAEPQRRARPEREVFDPPAPPPIPSARPRTRAGKPWPRMEQALRAADLLLQAGGFSVIVLDMASLAPEYAARVPLATWFRYRAAAERTQASVLLLTQHSCAKSSGELLLRFRPGRARDDEATVFTGSVHRLEVERRRFTQTPSNVVPLRKPPQSVSAAEWRSHAAWAGPGSEAR
jgi:recombination protein RecA